MKKNLIKAGVSLAACLVVLVAALAARAAEPATLIVKNNASHSVRVTTSTGPGTMRSVDIRPAETKDIAVQHTGGVVVWMQFIDSDGNLIGNETQDYVDLTGRSRVTLTITNRSK